MNALSTMLLIADAFVSLCDEMPLRKVSISDIVQRTGKNRKTFYYHFENKDRLIIWIFRYDMGQVLKKHFSESVLLYEKPSDDSISHFPYYITQKSGVRSLDHAEFFSCFAEVLEARRHFYREALIDNGPYSLRNYLYNLYVNAHKTGYRYHLVESLSAAGQHRFSGRVLHLRIPVLLHPPMRPDQRRAPCRQRRPVRQHHPQLS